jgi:hypothetical protein
VSGLPIQLSSLVCPVRAQAVRVSSHGKLISSPGLARRAGESEVGRADGHAEALGEYLGEQPGRLRCGALSAGAGRRSPVPSRGRRAPRRRERARPGS